jgi:hypothetical protein
MPKLTINDVKKAATKFEFMISKLSINKIPPVDLDALHTLSRRLGKYYVYREVPISQITGNTEIWSEIKLVSVQKAIAEGKPIAPIILAPRDNGEFGIVDGIHRTAAAKEAGYNYMPAFVSTEDKEDVIKQATEFDFAILKIAKPPFIADQKIWNRAKKVSKKYWKNYDDPYPVVVEIYKNMGGKIKKKKKKSSSNSSLLMTQYVETLNKYGSAAEFARIINQYENIAECTKDYANGLKVNAEHYKSTMDPNSSVDIRIHKLMLQEAQMIEQLVPELQYLEDEINEMHNIDNE